MSRVYIALYLYSFFLFSDCNESKTDKRLLLSDPNYFESRISHLEALVQQQAADKQAMETKIAQLDSYVQQLKSSKSTNGGAIFVRWGRTTCPNNTASTIYSGYAAGGWYHSSGAGSNYICLPRDPIYGNRSKALANNMNYVYGVEYESNFFGYNAFNEDAPCAVCRSDSDTTFMMLPGRNACYSGWTRQYHGYLASSLESHVAQYNHVCVDQDPEFVFGGQSDSDGALFYPVGSYCGSLQCPPYLHKVPLTCVVCTK